MRKPNKTTYWIIIILLLLTLGYWLLNRGRYDWKESYSPDSDQPYGCQFIQSLLDDYIPGRSLVTFKKPLSLSLKDTGDSINYLYIGNAIFINEKDREFLLKKIRAGSSAFLFIKSMPRDLIRALDTNLVNLPLMKNYIVENEIRVDFKSSELKTDSGFTFYRKYGPDTLINYTWDTYKILNDSLNIEILGYANDTAINYLRIKHGGGYLYLNTTPLALTNYFIDDSLASGYASKALSYMIDADIYYDRYSFIPDFFGGGGQSKRSPLDYLYSQPALTWAYYILIGLALIYLFIGARRRQNIIPVLPKNENASLSFIENLGRLFFLEKSHLYIARLNMKHFKSFVRKRYLIVFRDDDEKCARHIAEKSEIEFKLIKNIQHKSKYVQRADSVSAEFLMDLHETLHTFYTNAK